MIVFGAASDETKMIIINSVPVTFYGGSNRTELNEIHHPAADRIAKNLQ